MNPRIAAFSWTDPAVIAAVIGAVATLIAAIPAWWAIKRDRTRREDSSSQPTSEPPNPLPAATRSGQAPKWKETDGGWFFRAGPSDSGALIVLIHGLLGDAIDTWQLLPALLREAVIVPFDLFSYSYPAKLLNKASLEEGTRDLLRVLNGRFANYPHVVFVTHSAGGIVLKKVLCEDLQATLETLISSRADFAAPLNSISLRSRQIFNIAVPHSGGSFFGSITFIPLFLLLSPLLILVGKILAAAEALKLRRPSRRGYAYGYNRIPWEVRYNNPHLLALENTYRQLIAECDRRRIPRPVSLEINGSHDTTIRHPRDDVHKIDESRRTSSLDTATLIFRGRHPTVKHATSVDDGIIVLIARAMERYREKGDLTLATSTIARSLTLDRGTPLIGPQDLKRLEGQWSVEGGASR